MVEALETIKQMLLETLAFAGVARKETDSLIKKLLSPLPAYLKCEDEKV